MRADDFLEAVVNRRTSVAETILLESPEIARFSIHTAAAAGDVEAVAAFVRADRAAATATYGRMETPPLIFAAGSPLHHRPPGPEAFVEIARTLLDAGADANSYSLFFGGGDHGDPISALYFAIISDHRDIVSLLLARGARTQDGESIYHAAQHNRRECLELLRQHGADFSSRQAPYGNTPLYFLAGHHADEDGRAAWAQGVRWLLDHGADPDVTSGEDQATPLHALAGGRRQRVLEWVVEAGADVNARRRDGRTPYSIALRAGNRAGAKFLREHGASPGDAAPLDRFLRACHAGSDAEARAILAEHPDLMSSLSPEDKSALSDAVRNDNPAGLRQLVAMGFDLSWEEPEGGTPLHTAAWLGKPDLVRTLIEMGASVNQREHQFGCSPLGWAAHGSGFGSNNEIPRPGMGTDDDYCAIVDVLAEAGATREAAFNKWGESPENMASSRVRQRMIARGLAPE